MHDLSNYERMMVCLDLSDMDETLLKYASMAVKAFTIQKVYFCHVVTSLELPKEIAHKYPKLLAPVDETIEKEIEYSLSQYFDAPEEVETRISIVSGKITDEIIKSSKTKLVDLLLVGRKKNFKSTGLDERKIAKGCPTSVLMVPEAPRFDLNKIMISIDFSEHSQKAFELGIAIQKNSGAKLLSNHVYKVPTGYHSSGKSYEEFAEIMLENTKKECQRFFTKMDLEGVDFDHTYMLDDDTKPADKIYASAKEADVDMIILGSKGRSAAAAFLLGSVAESLLVEDEDIPLFIVKMHDENQSFIKTLINL